MPYYIGDVIKESARLVARTPEEFKKTGIDVKVRTTVDGIDTRNGRVYLAGGESIPYDCLVMATGADAVRLDIPGKDLEGVHVIRDLMHTLKIKSDLNEGGVKKAVLIGGGYIGLEMCEALRNVGIEVRVVDILPRPAYHWDPEFTRLIVEELGKSQVEFLPETKPLAIEKGDGSRLKLYTNNGDLDADLVLMGVGTRSNTALAQDIGTQMGRAGRSRSTSPRRPRTRTSGPWGTAARSSTRSSAGGSISRWAMWPTSRAAWRAGTSVAHPVEFPGIVGAQAFKVFNLEVAATGLTEEEAAKYGFDPVSSLIWGLPIGRSLAKARSSVSNSSATRRRASSSARSASARWARSRGSAPFPLPSGRGSPSAR